MPRSQVNPAVKVVEFFKTAELPEAVLVMALCAAELLQRQRRSKEAKARQAPKVADTLPPNRPFVRQTPLPGKKKGAKRKATKPPVTDQTTLQ